MSMNALIATRLSDKVIKQTGEANRGSFKDRIVSVLFYGKEQRRRTLYPRGKTRQHTKAGYCNGPRYTRGMGYMTKAYTGA